MVVLFFLEAGWFQLHWYYDIVEVTEEINMLCMYTVIRGVFGPLLLCVFHRSVRSGVLKGFPWKRFLPRFYGSNQQKGCDPWMERLISCTVWGCLKHLAKFSEPSTVWLQGSRWPINSTKFIWNFLRTGCFVSPLRMMSFDRTCNGIWHRNCSLEEYSLRCQSRSDVTQHAENLGCWNMNPKSSSC